MFFKKFFLSAADCLDLKFRGYETKSQNPADRGELAEIFIKEFLEETISGNLKIFRGGKVFDVSGKYSGQIDILACSNNTLTIFKDKGIYPIESVCGVFSVTSNLDRKKFEESLDNIKTLPLDNPTINVFPGFDANSVVSKWKKMFPFKCVWAFSGKISYEWELYLNSLVKDKPELKNTLPDLIVVNKVGMIVKIKPGDKFHDGRVITKDFHYTDFTKAAKGEYWSPFVHILNKLYLYSNWQYFIQPNYTAYFNADIELINKEK